MSNTPQTLRISTRARGVAQVTMACPNVFNAFDETMLGEFDAFLQKRLASWNPSHES